MTTGLSGRRTNNSDTLLPKIAEHSGRNILASPHQGVSISEAAGKHFGSLPRVADTTPGKGPPDRHNLIDQSSRAPKAPRQEEDEDEEPPPWCYSSDSELEQQDDDDDMEDEQPTTSAPPSFPRRLLHLPTRRNRLNHSLSDTSEVKTTWNTSTSTTTRDTDEGYSSPT